MIRNALSTPLRTLKIPALAVTFLLLLGSVELVLFLFPILSIHQSIASYPLFHLGLEIISILVSLMVFSVGWQSEQKAGSGNLVVLSTVFFFVAVLDFFHIVTQPGTAGFTPFDGLHQTLYFWLLARFLVAVTLLLIALRHWQYFDSRLHRRVLFVGLSAIVFGYLWMVIGHPDWLPGLFFSGSGLTPIKKLLEYFIIGLNIAAAGVLLKNMTNRQAFNVSFLFEAVCIMAMSEFFFTIYTVKEDGYNLVGHIYKVMAYLLIYRAIVVEVIVAPYTKLQAAEQQLLQTNSRLEERVAARTLELTKANQTLDEAYVELQRVQNELIEREKIAALGSMVAGISHELNTPLGNALLMSSSLLEQLEQLPAILQQPGLRLSVITDWRDKTLSMARLCDQSINRGLTLVASFKQVAVDQTSDRRRVFDLGEFVDDILAVLRPGLKSISFTLVNEIPHAIQMDSFPGPLGQVITNLVQNALIHGFEGRTQGQIVLTAKQSQGSVLLSVSDNGAGMSPAIMAHIFEPFFTTKLGLGGSGLGLAICYRITTTILAGNIYVDSQPTEGTRFVVSIPQRTPEIARSPCPA